MVSIIRLLLLYLVQFTLYGRKQLGTAIKYTTKVLLNICNYYFKWATSAEIVTTTFFKWSIPSLFFVYFWSFQANNFCNGLMWKISVKYPVLGFEPTTSWTWVVSGNHHLLDRHPAAASRTPRRGRCCQCDQIRPFIEAWATFKVGGINFQPKLAHVWKCVKSIHFSSISVFGPFFDRHWATFYSSLSTGHSGCCTSHRSKQWPTL